MGSHDGYVQGDRAGALLHAHRGRDPHMRLPEVVKDGKTVYQCDVHAAVDRRRLQTEDDCSNSLVCGKAEETFCYTPTANAETVCDCEKHYQNGESVEVCGTANLRKADATADVVARDVA